MDCWTAVESMKRVSDVKQLSECLPLRSDILRKAKLSTPYLLGTAWAEEQV